MWHLYFVVSTWNMGNPILKEKQMLKKAHTFDFAESKDFESYIHVVNIWSGGPILVLNLPKSKHYMSVFQ